MKQVLIGQILELISQSDLWMLLLTLKCLHVIRFELTLAILTRALDVDAFLASNYSTSQGFAILKEPKGETLIDFIT